MVQISGILHAVAFSLCSQTMPLLPMLPTKARLALEKERGTVQAFICLYIGLRRGRVCGPACKTHSLNVVIRAQPDSIVHLW